LPWRDVDNHEHIVRNLSMTLGNISEEIAASIVTQQKARDSSLEGILDNRITLDHIGRTRRYMYGG
jgi:hypothetical protein